ncbi:MAG: aldehyde dehydrogenase family protein [bacterium]|nr:aldehyde dehydrogenase family protein [bacterium]
MDKDLLSIQEARDLLRAAVEAQRELAQFSQRMVNDIVRAVAEVALANSERLARLAVEDTGLGKYEDKITKNKFAAEEIFRYIEDIPTCGVIDRDDEKGIWEIAAPVGVIAGIVPTTNPTSTVIYKALIALKARNAVIFSPHPNAIECTAETVRLLAEAAVSAGAPKNSLTCLRNVSMEAAELIMSDDAVGLILATGGLAMVKAAYSSGKPAYGVGPGNVPVYVDRSADIANAARCIIDGKTFDNGVICSSEQAAVADAPIRERLIDEFRKLGCYFLNDEEKAKVEGILLDDGHISPAVIGQTAATIASRAGFRVPENTPALIAFEDNVGWEVGFSREKLSPLLAFYDVDGWEQGCERCIEILENGGLGHTLSIHANDEEVITQFGLKKPVSRVLVNTVSTFGAVGISTNLPPSLTLGTGTMGGNITSDNITPRHLLHIRRVAFDKDATSTGGKIEMQTLRKEPPVFTSDGKLPGVKNTDRESVEKLVREMLGDMGYDT